MAEDQRACTVFSRHFGKMRKLLQFTLFLGWIAAIIWTVFELEKIEFFQTLIARLAN